MSASHSINLLTNAKLPPAKKMQLEYGNIEELLTKGLGPFVGCFAPEGDKDKIDAFIVKLATELGKKPSDKENFNTAGTLLVKASYPLIFTLQPAEEGILLKMGFIPNQPHNTQEMTDRFFHKALIVEFINSTVRDKYRAEMLKFVDAVYGIIESSIHSIEHEKTLQGYDKDSQLITDKEKQKPIFSSIDLQVQTAINNIKLGYDALMLIKAQANKDKITRAKLINDSLAKIRAIATQLGGEYAKNLSAHSKETLKMESDRNAEAANRAQRELDETKVALEEERRKAKRLAIANENLRKQQVDLRLQQIKSESQSSTVNKTSLKHDFDDLMAQMKSSSSNETSLFNSLLRWEKAALLYTQHKPKKTGNESSWWFGGKKISAQHNREMQDLLVKFLQQCVIMAEHASSSGDSPKDCLFEQICALNQHACSLQEYARSLHKTYSHDLIEENTVASQLTDIADTITTIAVKRFGYNRPTSRTSPLSNGSNQP